MTSLSQSSIEVCNSSRIILLYRQLQHLWVERIKMYTEYLIGIKHAVMLTYILGETGLHILFVRRAAVIFFLHGQKERLFCTSYQTWEYVQYGRPLGNTSMKRKNWPTVYSSATGKTRHDSAHSANRCVHKVSCTPWCQFILQTVLSLAMKNNKFVFRMMKQLMHKGFLSFKYCMGKN